MSSDLFAAQLAATHPDLRPRLHATGTLPAEAVAAHLCACDLLLQPYPDGATGRRTSLMAGLALGVPIVTTCGPLSERLWLDRALVEMAPAGDQAALLGAVEKLLGDPAGRARLGRRGRRGYEEHFSLERTVAVLREPLGTSRPADVEAAG
jgi:glycosyltransferase involved in cell wall biosynthesis